MKEHFRLYLISIVLLLAGCSRQGFPRAPYFAQEPIVTASSTEGWSKYLSYGSPPDHTLILGGCDTFVDFPGVIYPKETVIEHGYTATTFYANDEPDSIRYGGYYGNVLLMADSKGGGRTEERTVIEPDIYTMEDNLLFALNKLKGLYALRVSPEKKPHFVSGTYIQGFPNELYMKDGTAIVVSAGFEPFTDYDPVLAEGVKGQAMSVGTLFSEFLRSKAVFLNTGNPEQMGIVRSFDLDGQLIESRVVGNVLYAVTFTPAGLYISSFDFSDLSDIRMVDQVVRAVPYVPDDLTLAYVHLHITPELLFVSLPTTLGNTEVLILDISDPQGAISPKGSMTMSGHVLDRFKMDYDRGTFRVITGGWWRNPVSTLFIYDVSDLSSPALLSQLSVGYRENLFASRFDGDRAYIVTYLRMDPLWVIDLSDPRKPKIAGKLTVPGWSQYIEPLRDRLVTLGVDDTVRGERKVSVSLFDVGTRSQPSLLDAVSVGRNATSYGYADFKAFKVLSDLGLILLPYTDREGWWWWGRNAEDAVALIDLKGGGLALRGTLSSIGTVERPFVRDGDLYVLAQRSFQIADIRDRSRPESVSMIRTLRPAQSLQADGKFGLVEDEDGWWEVVKMDTPDLLPTARLRAKGSEADMRLDGTGIYAIGAVGVEEFSGGGPMPMTILPEPWEYQSPLSFYALDLPDNGRPSVRACFRLKNGNFRPEKYIPISEDLLGLYGWGYHSGDPGYSVSGVLLIDKKSWTPKKMIALKDSSYYPGIFTGMMSPKSAFFYPYMTPQSIIAVRNTRVYRSSSTYGSGAYTTYLSVLDLAEPMSPTLTQHNVPGWPVYVSEDETRVVTVETDGGDYYLGGAGFSTGGTLIRGGRIPLDGYPVLRFTDREAAALTRGAWFWGYQSMTAPTVSVIGIGDISAPAVKASKSLPGFWWTLAGLEDGLVFLSTGPYANPVKIREAYVSQWAWSDWEGSYLWAALDLDDLSLRHVFPATVSTSRPVNFRGRVLVPAGSYGLEIFSR